MMMRPIPNRLPVGDDEDCPGLTVSDSDQELEPDYASPVLKRLRRGTNTDKCSAKSDRDDDIQELSSPEDFPADPPASTRSHFSSCSSRVPLHCSGVLSNQPSISLGKRKQFDVPASAASGTSSIASLFQRSARSPLRRFQLLDSDSEDDHPSTKKFDSSEKDQLSVASKPKRKESGSMPCTGDLWKDFSPAISKIQTPSLMMFLRIILAQSRRIAQLRNEATLLQVVVIVDVMTCLAFSKLGNSWIFPPTLLLHLIVSSCTVIQGSVI